MKRTMLTFNDDYMQQGISFSKYVTSPIGLDLQLRMQYK